ncbi:MAG: sel1 repeat family protein [Prevotellaceae bacterium]|jgi:tetratricopeptide (TPR) repeat protein|nr:sel1 repeat family protein [Prevotellaceae bacterium]
MNKSKIIRTIFCTMLLCLFSLSVFGGNDNDSIITAKLRLANTYFSAGGHEKAYLLYHECADAGNAQAMNAIGILLQRGWGVAKDEAASVAWFQRAAENGYGRAFHNLAQIYAKGLGVEQDFAKAVDYTEKLLPYMPKAANSRLGYYYYKGLGVKQDYEKAVAHFQQSAEMKSADAEYFLGLCYRNGYGVARNEGEAQFYLQKATEMGHHYSKEELAEEISETQVPAQRLQMKPANGMEQIFRKIMQQKVNGKIAGTYSGVLTVYDYSGRQIVREVPLKISFGEPDSFGDVNGEWTEADSIRATFEAVLTDSTLQFVNTSYARTDYYNKRQAIKWNFTKAVLEKADINGITSLTGNVQMFSPKSKEPEKPMYISLQQTASAAESEQLTVIPMLNGNDVNVSFALEQASNASINIFSLNGALVFFRNIGKSECGHTPLYRRFKCTAGLVRCATANPRKANFKNNHKKITL